jgi:hypothetical protein
MSGKGDYYVQQASKGLSPTEPMPQDLQQFVKFGLDELRDFIVRIEGGALMDVVFQGCDFPSLPKSLPVPVILVKQRAAIRPRVFLVEYSKTPTGIIKRTIDL